MSNSISTLLLRNLSDVFGEKYSVTQKAVYFVVVTRLIELLV
jgi:hypothetical protein